MQSTMLYVEALLKFSMLFQSAKQTNTSYYELFKSRQDTLKSHGGQPGYHEQLYKNTGSSSCWSMELQTRLRWKSLFGLNTKSRRWHPPAKISAADFLFSSRITRGMPAWNNNKATHSSWETTNTLIQWWHQIPWWRIGRASRANKNNGRRALWKKKGDWRSCKDARKK